ncbi:transaldolase [Catelliglobosispora koreensis]|uniref:transaldolase n=1 Tax=Catelliglobosispora koreensis TaxID=129052 RepID=UPI000378E98D|nr:transaldolase [Catelliglobosispora koreensis]
MSGNLKALSDAGVAVWLDDISRERLTVGGSHTALTELRDNSHVVGVTSNPTIFQQAVSSSDDYDQQLTDLAVRKISVEEALRMITTYDVRWACDVMRPVFDATNGLDGRVSIEVDPRLAHVTSPTVAEAKQLWWLVDRPNLFIKIPATRAGLPAITAVLAQGISVNVTLIFSLDRYKDVMDAWLSGLEQADQNGHDLSKIESVASFFVSRVDTEIDKRLDALGKPELKGKAAVANAQLAYEEFQKVMQSARWVSLKAKGANPQRPLWASTGTKNPDYSPTLYVDELVAPGTVNTMPEKTLQAVAASSTVISKDAITPNLAEAHATMEALKAAGVDYDDVVEVLEREGVEKFSTSWQELLDGVKSALESHG